MEQKKLEIEKFLSDAEQSEIIAFNSKPVLKNAIRKVLLSTIYNNGVLRKDVPPDPTRNGALALAVMAVNGQTIASNEQLGEDLRAVAQGVALLEQGLARLEEITSKEGPEPEKVNPAI